MAAPQRTDSYIEEKLDAGDLTPVNKLEQRTGSDYTWEGVSFTEQDLKKATWRCDIFVTGLIASYYLLSFIDRANIGNARIAGLQRDLGMSDYEYSLALTIFYIPYILIEIPSNMLLKRLGPHRVLPLMVCAFGIVTCFQGFVQSTGGLIAARFMLGLVEGPMTPGAVLYIAMFFRRRRMQLRTAIFFTMSAMAGAFSGLLAYGLVRITAGGYAGWRWLFFLEGGFTAVWAAITMFFVAPSPSRARWLSPAQRAAVLHTLAADQQQHFEQEKVDVKAAAAVLWHPQTLILLIPSICNGFLVFGLAYFTPTIVRGMQFDAITTQIMTVPPYAAGLIFAIALAVYADRKGQRSYVFAFSSFVGLIGFAIAQGTGALGARYFALFLQIMATSANSPALGALFANNYAPTVRRGVGIALCFQSVNIGGIASVWLYPSWNGPRYLIGNSVDLAACIVIIIGSLGNAWYLSRLNAQRDAEMSSLPPNHKFPEGPIDDRDVRFRFVT